jgi:hypothetical protein
MMGEMHARIRFALLVLLLLVLAPAAQAINCKSWERLGPGQRSATVDRMIQSTVAGSGGRSYRVDRGAVSRCLQRYAQSIAYDFDGACADPSTAGMQALNEIFKNYVWSCVR